MTMKILAFAGSSRSNSLNQKLLDIAAMAAAESGAQVTSIHLRDYPLPFYCGDLEAKFELPEGAVRLQAMLAESDALLIASPDYNGGYRTILKKGS
jgi:NAD(P)H-dependent FMN reductase